MNTQISQHYSDILNHPHHRSLRHPHMSRRNRAAQFAPFAALTGYDAQVAEGARLTDERLELTEDEQALLDERMQLLNVLLPERPEVTVTYFVPDKRKDGGAYETFTGHVRRIDEFEGLMIFTEGTRIPLWEICFIAGNFFR